MRVRGLDSLEGKLRWVIALLMATAILELVVERAHAIRLGPVEASPSITYSGMYDSNIFIREKDKEEDYISLIEAALDLKMGILARHQIELGYKAQGYAYASNDDENRVDQEANIRAGFFSPMGLEAKLYNFYNRAYVPRQDPEYPQKELYDRNVATAELAYRFADVWKAQIQYENTYFRYDQEEREYSNFDKHVFGGILFYRFRPLTSALIEYNYGVVDYPEHEESNNTFNSVLAGLTWEPTGIIRGTLKGGYTWKNFEEEEREDKNTFILSTELEAHYTEFTAVGLSAFRHIIESDFYGTDYYTSTGGGAWIEHKFTSKISGRAGGGYSRNSYNNFSVIDTKRARRKDYLWNAHASMGYQIQDWLGVGLEYRFGTRDSEFDVFDYDRHVGLFYIKASI